MASSLLGAVPMSALSPNLSFSRSHSVTGSVSIAAAAPSASISSLALTSSNIPLIYCGRGDKKTAKGKRFNHSFGNVYLNMLGSLMLNRIMRKIDGRDVITIHNRCMPDAKDTEFLTARPRNKKKGRGPPRVAAPPAAPKRDPFDDGQVVKIEIHEN